MVDLDTAPVLDNTSLCIEFNLGNCTLSCLSIKTNIILMQIVCLCNYQNLAICSLVQSDNERMISKPSNILPYYQVKAR